MNKRRTRAGIYTRERPSDPAPIPNFEKGQEVMEIEPRERKEMFSSEGPRGH